MSTNPRIKEAEKRLEKLRLNHDLYSRALMLSCEHLVRSIDSCPYEESRICPRELYESCDNNSAKCWGVFFYRTARGEFLIDS